MNKRFSFLCLLSMIFIIGNHTPDANAMDEGVGPVDAAAIPQGFRHLRQYACLTDVMPTNNLAPLDEMEQRIQATFDRMPDIENDEKAKHMTFARDALAQYADTVDGFTDDNVEGALNATLGVFLRLVASSIDNETYFASFIFNQFTSLPVFYNRPLEEHPLLLILMAQVVATTNHNDDEGDYDNGSDNEENMPQEHLHGLLPAAENEDEMVFNGIDAAQEMEATIVFSAFNALFRGVPLPFAAEEDEVEASEFAGWLRKIFDYTANTGMNLPPAFIAQMRSTLNMGRGRPFTTADAHRLEQALEQQEEDANVSDIDDDNNAEDND